MLQVAVALTAAAIATGVAHARALARSTPPKLVYQVTAQNEALLARCPTLHKQYQVFPWRLSGHVETLFAAFIRRSPKLQYDRKCITMADGGTIALDFEPPEFDKGLPEDAPVLLVLPGLTGGSRDTYVQHTVKAARAIGVRAIVFNSRGIADAPLTTPQFYSASYTGDLRAIVEDVQQWYPKSLLLMAGFSLGANIMVTYLGEEGVNTPVAAAISLCNPFDLAVSDKAVQKGFSRIYAFNLGRNLSRNFKKHRHLFEGLTGGFDVERGCHAKTIRDYDEAITIHSFGWPSVDAYYKGASSAQMIPKVRIPLLCIQAEDDPLALGQAVPLEAIAANSHCILAMTSTGGHLGWVSGPEAPFGGPWTDGVLQEFYLSVMHQNQEAEQADGFVGNARRSQ